MNFSSFFKSHWVFRTTTFLAGTGALGVGMGALMGSGCSSGKVASRSMHFDPASQPAEVIELWSKKLPGPLTDLSLSRDGHSILVASIPDAETGEGRYELTRFNQKGKGLWTIPLKSQLKSQTISADGNLVVISNYNGELIGLDGSGKTLWTIEASCKPILLSSVKKILCQHDDDTIPEVALEIFDWSGKKLSSFSSKQDLLTLKVAGDEMATALAFTGGRVRVLNHELKQVREVKVKGEILDVAISHSTSLKGSKTEPTWTLAVLSYSSKNGQLISVFDSKGSLRATAEPGSHAEQIEMSSTGSDIFVYGNSPKGQYLAVFGGPEAASADKQGSLKQKWQRSDKRYADYSSSIVASDSQVMAGFEDVAPNTRSSHLVVFDLDGKMKANIELKTEEGAYLYSYAFSPDKGILAVGTDDSKLSVFSVGK